MLIWKINWFLIALTVIIANKIRQCHQHLRLKLIIITNSKYIKLCWVKRIVKYSWDGTVGDRKYSIKNQ